VHLLERRLVQRGRQSSEELRLQRTHRHVPPVRAAVHVVRRHPAVEPLRARNWHPAVDGMGRSRIAIVV
jgi:hypothetical protein